MPKTRMIGGLSDCGCDSGGTSGAKGRRKPLRAGSHRRGIGGSVVLEGTRGLGGVGRDGEPDMVCKVNRRGKMICRSPKKTRRRRGR